MRARRDHPFGFVWIQLLVEERRVERFDISGGERVIEVFVARAAGRIAGAALALAEDGEIHLRVVQDLGECPRGLLRRGVVRTRAADPVQHLKIRILRDRRRHGVGIFPFLAFSLRDAPRIARAFEIAERVVELLRKLALRHDRVAPVIDDVGKLFAADRAHLHARTARRAGPERTFAHHEFQHGSRADLFFREFRANRVQLIALVDFDG